MPDNMLSKLKAPPPVRRFGNYEIECTGVVWKISSSDGPLKPTIGPDGDLYIPNTRTSVARVVAEAWIKKPPGATVVIHLDDNKMNVHASNLRWC